MGWFRKMFFSDASPAASAPVAAPVPAPEPAPAPAPAPASATPGQDDPYRGAAFVEVDPVDEVVTVGKPKPIYHYKARVLAIEPNRRGPLPLRWVVYSGKSGERIFVRKVTFGEDGYRIDWEHESGFEKGLDAGYIARIGDRVVMPRATGLIAIHVATGRPCWELPHPAPLQSALRLDSAGNLVLVFADQSWMIVSLGDGATVSEGVARNDRDIETVTRDTTELGRDRQNQLHYGGAQIDLSNTEISVSRGNSLQADDPTAPTKGNYPLDGEWEGGDWTALASGKLAIELKRSFAGKEWAAIGLLDPTSLEPRQLLELGQVTSSVSCWVVDELLVVDTDLPERPDDVVFIIDPEAERIVAMFREDKADAFMFDRDGNRIWEAPL